MTPLNSMHVCLVSCELPLFIVVAAFYLLPPRGFLPVGINHLLALELATLLNNYGLRLGLQKCCNVRMPFSITGQEYFFGGLSLLEGALLPLPLLIIGELVISARGAGNMRINDWRTLLLRGDLCAEALLRSLLAGQEATWNRYRYPGRLAASCVCLVFLALYLFNTTAALQDYLVVMVKLALGVSIWYLLFLSSVNRLTLVYLLELRYASFCTFTVIGVAGIPQQRVSISTLVMNYYGAESPVELARSY